LGVPANWAFADQSGGSGSRAVALDPVTGSNSYQLTGATSPGSLWVGTLYTGTYAGGATTLGDTDFQAVVRQNSRGVLMARADTLIGSGFCNTCYIFQVMPNVPGGANILKITPGGGGGVVGTGGTFNNGGCDTFKMRLSVTTNLSGQAVVEGFVNSGSIPVASFTDSAAGSYLSGDIGMMSFGGVARYDDLKVNNTAICPSGGMTSAHVPGAKATPRDPLADRPFFVAPNPASLGATAFFHLQERGKARLSLFSLSGELILQREFADKGDEVYREYLDFGSLASGLYVAILEQYGDFGWKKLGSYKVAVLR
jgi:hypothetical protein